MALFIHIIFMLFSGIMVFALCIGAGIAMMSWFTPNNQGWLSIVFPGIGALFLVESLLFFVFTAPEEGMRPENIMLYWAAINVAVAKMILAIVVQYQAQHAPDEIDVEYQQLLAKESR